jgi:hypothetical protein
MDRENPLGTILHDERKREGFKVQLEGMFPACRDPLPERLVDLLKQLSDRDLILSQSEPGSS